MCMFFLVSPFNKLVIFPPFVLAVLDLYCEHFSSHLRWLVFLHSISVLRDNMQKDCKLGCLSLQ